MKYIIVKLTHNLHH